MKLLVPVDGSKHSQAAVQFIASRNTLIGAWGWIGIVLLATGLLRFCPVYPLLGVNTCKPGVR